MTNNNNEEDIPKVVGCIYHEQTPHVPSIEGECSECGAKLWISDFIHETVPDAKPMCIPCVIAMIADTPDATIGTADEIELLPGQGEALKAQTGMTDVDLDTMKVIAKAKLDEMVEVMRLTREAQPEPVPDA